MENIEEKYIIEFLNIYGRFTPDGVVFLYSGQGKGNDPESLPAYSIITEFRDDPVWVNTVKRAIDGGIRIFDTTEEANQYAKIIREAIENQNTSMNKGMMSKKTVLIRHAIYKGVHYE